MCDKIDRYYDACSNCNYIQPIEFTTDEDVIFKAIYDSFSSTAQKCSLLLVCRWLPILNHVVKTQLKAYIRTFGDKELINKLNTKIL
jgi:hypothetical protein